MTNPAFESYYENIWGERWPSLRAALLQPAAIVPFNDGLLKPYMMDRASILAASCLKLIGLSLHDRPTGKSPYLSPFQIHVLDACAAPGGKSLVLAARMAANTRLLANELSSERRRRLVNTLDEHLPADIRERVTVSGFDAAAQGGKKSEWQRFDAILLDAPCSSERHVLQSPKALAEWTPARPRQLAQRQWALLSSAFLLLKPGGSLVYITCAITPEENDGPVSRLLEKYAGKIETDEPDFPDGEKTAYGRIILPNTAGGMGPMYVARFRKC